MGLRKCPFCAEEIQEEAKICRFCKFDLRTGKQLVVPISSDQKVPRGGVGIGDGVKLGCGMFIVLPLILIVAIVASFFVVMAILGSPPLSPTT